MSILREINIFDKKNATLKNSFFFFFFIAIFGYAAVMLSLCPYNDDYCRYVANMHIGTTASARYTTFFLELLMYFSSVITDAAPFTQIISCAFLAYSAIVCMKIFDIDNDDKYAKLCLIPIVVNPYLLECLMYRFDNLFMTLSILCSVIAAYLSKLNDKKLLIIQSILLLHSLLLYQAGLAAYFIICIYLLLVEISKNNILSVFFKIRYYLYALFITAVSYFPFAMSIRYFKKDGRILINPINSDGMKCIFKNIGSYVLNLKVDWLDNVVGQLFFLLTMIFLIFFIADIFRNLKNKIKAVCMVAVVLLLLLLLFIAPFGVCPFLSAMEDSCGRSIHPRMICCFGILISIVLYKNYSVIKQYKILKSIYVIYLCCFAIWNVIFLNSAGNIIHYYRKAQEHVLYDLSKDIAEISHLRDSKFSYICIKGMISSRAMENFSIVYPMINRIIPENWPAACYCTLALFSHEIGDCIRKYGIIGLLFEEKVQSKTLIKSHLWYDIYIVNDRILLCLLKKNHKFETEIPPMLQIRDN